MAKKKKKGPAGQQPISAERYIRERARKLPLGDCYRTSDLFDVGEGYVIVTRRHASGKITAGFFLVDVYCVGVKDTFWRFGIEPYELDELMDRYEMFETCAYDEAHSIICGAVKFAAEAGIQPHKDFAVTRRLLEEDDGNVPAVDCEFGRDGKHFLIAHSNLEASRYLPLLNKNLGEENYDILVGVGDYRD